MNLGDLFAVGAARDPDHIAIDFRPGPDPEPRRTRTYRELVDGTRRLAAALHQSGLGPGDRVALFLGNGPEVAALHWAALQLGLVLVPLNLAYRRREIEHIVADAEPRLVVTDAQHRPILLECLAGVEAPPEVGTLDELANVATSPAPEPHPVAGDDLAFLLYTSGTTGRSKGAMLSHDNVLATVTGLLAAWGWTREDRLLLTLPLFHTHGLVVGLYTALAAGATVLLRPRFDADAVLLDLDREQATLFFGVPTMYGRLLERLRAHGRPSWTTVRLLCSGSAPLPAEHALAIEELTGLTILERYGMTETGMLTSNLLAGPRRAGTVGVPLPGVSVRIVDAQDLAVDDGDPGRLQVRGSNVFAGYWRAPEQTAASFVLDPDRRLWFDTGDLARRDPGDGYLTLLGRSRELIISGGFNIYPREIEEVLLQVSGVREAAVVGRAHPDWGEVPVAFLVAAEEVSEADLRTACDRELARFKRPAAFIRRDTLPRNALGKVQKHLLEAG